MKTAWENAEKGTDKAAKKKAKDAMEEAERQLLIFKQKAEDQKEAFRESEMEE